MIDGKAKSRQEKAEETKRKIYSSAEKLFAQFGFDAVNIDAIVKDAGVAKGSFYVHFESRDYLIALLVNDYVNQVDIDYKGYLKTLPPEMSADRLLLALVGKIADVLIHEIGQTNMALLYRFQLGNKLQTDSVISYKRDLYSIISELIDRGIKENVFKTTMDSLELVKHFVTALRGLTFEWCLRYPEFDLKEQAVQHFEILLAGICGGGNYQT